MSPSECSRLRCGNRFFDAGVRLYPLVAVHTLDLGEYLQLQVGRRRATPSRDERWCARLV